MNMDRINIRTSTKITDDTNYYPYHDLPNLGLKKKISHFKKYHPYDDHSYSKFHYERKNFSGNQKPRSTENKSDKVVYRSAECRLTDYQKTEPTSADLHSSANDRTTDQKSANFPRQDDIAKCRLMKVNQVIEPQLKKLLHCIFNDKQNSETLELYAEKHGLGSNWQKHFSEEQIKNIRQYPDFEGFDSTLIFRCIEVLQDFNPTLIKNEPLKLSIDNTMKKFKSIRNMLCHNRKEFTDKQCHDIANSLKQPLDELLEIMNIWNSDMDIDTEKVKIWDEVQTVMSGGLNEAEFRYMCLLKAMHCNIESVLNEITKLICYDKEKRENFREYFKRKGMNNKTYKDTFFKEEKDVLESYSVELQFDLTLYCKIINACRKWHSSFRDNENNQKALSNILREIRVIRNYAIHKMLSMTPNECNVKAQELVDNLKELVDLVNNIQNKKFNMNIDAAKIYINEINSIMTVPYTLL